MRLEPSCYHLHIAMASLLTPCSAFIEDAGNMSRDPWPICPPNGLAFGLGWGAAGSSSSSFSTTTHSASTAFAKAGAILFAIIKWQVDAIFRKASGRNLPGLNVILDTGHYLTASKLAHRTNPSLS